MQPEACSRSVEVFLSGKLKVQRTGSTTMTDAHDDAPTTLSDWAPLTEYLSRIGAGVAPTLPLQAGQHLFHRGDRADAM